VPDTLAFRPAPTGACQVFAVCFDFEAKADVVVPLT
jgi:hypothetical protein